MADGLARAYSFFVHPMQRVCYRSNWFQELFSLPLSRSFLCRSFHRFFSSSPLLPSPVFSLSFSLFKERIEDTKRSENHRISKETEKRNEIERERKEVERRTSSSTFHEISSIFFRYFLSLFIPSVSYHAAAALRVARNLDCRIDYQATT